MTNLRDKEWREFFISGTDGIFTIAPGKRLIKSDMISGNIPFIGSTDSNNGITNWVGIANSSLDKNVLGVNYNGSVVENFYHNYSCVFSDDVKRLHLKNFTDNKYVLLFFKTIILQQKVKYSYGYKFNENRMERQKVLVPIDDNGIPDYSYMEDYIKEQLDYKKQQYARYAKKRISELESDNIPLLNDVKWNAFKVLDLFDYKRGNQNNMNSLTQGNAMLISAKNTNNGLKGFFSSDNQKKSLYHGNCITLNNDGDGGVGLAYYQPYDFLLDSHVFALYPKTDFSKYTMLFITISLSKQRVCFSHGYSISQERLSEMNIVLPSDEQRNPDVRYMDQYIKNLMLRKYQQYRNFASI